MISGEVVLLIIISLINIALWFVFFLRLKRSFSPQALLSDIKNEVEKLIIEINKTTLDDVTLLEERSKNLRFLIDEADKKMLLLQGQEKNKRREKEVLGRLSSKKSSHTTDRKAIESYKKMTHNDAEHDYSDSVQLSIDFDSYRIEDTSTTPTIENTVVETMYEDAPVDIPEIAHVEHSPIEEVPFKERVLQLAAKDFSSDYIANKLGCTVTEVQFIIDLYVQ